MNGNITKRKQVFQCIIGPYIFHCPNNWFRIICLQFSLSVQHNSPNPLSIIASFTSAIHVFLGLLFFRLPIGMHSSTSFGIFSWGNLFTCPNHYNCLDITKSNREFWTTIFCLIISFFIHIFYNMVREICKNLILKL